MKVLQINIFGNLSTGRITVDIYRTLRENGHEGIVAFSRNTIDEDVPNIQFGSKCSVYTDGIISRFTDNAGFNSRRPTKELIKKIKEYNPDIIHLHNLHGYYINVELLFEYLKEIGKPVLWTLHDCWPFTGHCCNFEYAGCEKWKIECRDCPQKGNYPASFVCRSKWNYNKKKALFTSIDNMALVTPSVWLRDLVQQSYMLKYPIEVIHNGVDLETFKPTYGDWTNRNGLQNKKIVLGVAGTWTPTKGLQDFIKLSELLSDDYRIVVVGVNKKQKKSLPQKITGIERTFDSNELAEIYTAAHVFVNPTYDDNFPNVNLEALACGTPVITYRTGGSPEAIDEKCGTVIDKGNIIGLNEAIRSSTPNHKACIERAKLFSRKMVGLQYIEVYKRLIGRVYQGNNEL